MANSIIGLLLEIAADPSKAEAAIAQLRATTVAESGNISSLWSGAMNAITGPTAIFTGGLVAAGVGMFELANKAAETGDRIFEASEKTGMAAEKLSGLMAISKETGGSFDGLTTALSRAGVNLEKAIIEPGLISSKVLAGVMGGSKQLAELGLKPMDERLQTVLHHIFALNDVGERNTALQGLMGRGWQQNVETLKLLAEQGYGPAIEQAKKFGLYYDAKSAADAHNFTVAMNSMKAEFEGLELEVGQKLMPTMRTFIDALVWTKGFFAGGVWMGNSDVIEFEKAVDKAAGAVKTLDGNTNHLTGTVKAHTDALAPMIAKLQDEIQVMDDAELPARQRIIDSYDREVRAAEAALAKKKGTVDEYNEVVRLAAEKRDAQLINEQNKEQARWETLHDKLLTEEAAFLAKMQLVNDTAQRKEEASELASADRRGKIQLEMFKKAIKAAQDQEAANLRLSLSYQALSVVGADTYNRMLQEAWKWSDGTVTAHQMTQAAILADTEAMLIQGIAQHSVYATMLQSLIGFLAKKAELKAAEDFAEALGMYAVYAASQYTDAAALHSAITFGLAGAAWGALGGGLMAAGSMIGGSGGGSSTTTKASKSSSVGGASPAPTGSGGSGGGGVGNGGMVQTLTVGTLVVSRLAVGQLVGSISDAVQNNDAFLISTRSKQATIPA